MPTGLGEEPLQQRTIGRPRRVLPCYAAARSGPSSCTPRIRVAGVPMLTAQQGTAVAGER
jgi:hypothetical protein